MSRNKLIAVLLFKAGVGKPQPVGPVRPAMQFHAAPGTTPKRPPSYFPWRFLAQNLTWNGVRQEQEALPIDIVGHPYIVQFLTVLVKAAYIAM